MYINDIALFSSSINSGTQREEAKKQKKKANRTFDAYGNQSHEVSTLL